MNSLIGRQVKKPSVFPAAALFAAAVTSATIVASLAGCAALDRRPPQEVVKTMAQERWDALVRQDIEAAYRFHSPGSRSVTSLADYKGSVKPGFWKSAKVEKVECAEERCQVHATIEYQHRGMRLKTPLKETWIKEGSQWWYLHK